MGTVIAVISKEGRDATKTAVAMLRSVAQKNAEKFGIASSHTVIVKSSIETLQNEGLNSPIIVGHVFSRILPQDMAQPLHLKAATMVFEGRLYEPAPNAFDAEFVSQKLQKNYLDGVTKIAEKFDGDFVFVIAENGQIIAGRDSLGVRPLYYGENLNFAALASQRKALWTVGIEKAKSFPPGHIAIVNSNRFQFKPVKTLTYSKPRKITIQNAVVNAQKLLQKSIQKRILGLKEAAVAFSGGLDSSIIAFLAEKSMYNIQLLHVSLPNQPEIEDAKKAAEALGLPLHVFLYDEDAVERILPKILRIIEESNPLQVSIAIPVYWVAEKTAEMGLKALFAGQGADELFGGYKKYVQSYQKHGREKVYQIIFDDIAEMHEINFERDFKICDFHGVELRLPFATYEIANFVSRLSPELKIIPSENWLRKLVLRYVAKNLGLPSFIIEKPKKAVQYATGVSRTLEKIAHREGLSLEAYLHRTFETVVKRTNHYE